MLSFAVSSQRLARLKPFHLKPWNQKKPLPKFKKGKNLLTTAGFLPKKPEVQVNTQADGETPEIQRFAVSPTECIQLINAVHGQEEVDIQFRVFLNADISRMAVRGVCQLPHSIGKTETILAFCEESEAPAMLAAGADFAGITEPIRRINAGAIMFDRCLASFKIMPEVLKVAKILGPRKLMPNPRSGTVVHDLEAAVKQAKSGNQLEYRAVASGPEVPGDAEVVINLGSVRTTLLENMKFFVGELLSNQPRSRQAETQRGSSREFNFIVAKYFEKQASLTRAGEDLPYFAGGQLEAGGWVFPIDPQYLQPKSGGWSP